MNWFKSAQLSNLGSVIGKWLIQSYRGPADMHLVHQDLDVNGVSDPSTLEGAIAEGLSMVEASTKQTSLVPWQEELLMGIRSRFQGDDGGGGELEHV